MIYFRDETERRALIPIFKKLVGTSSWIQPWKSQYGCQNNFARCRQLQGSLQSVNPNEHHSFIWKNLPGIQRSLRFPSERSYFWILKLRFSTGNLVSGLSPYETLCLEINFMRVAYSSKTERNYTAFLTLLLLPSFITYSRAELKLCPIWQRAVPGTHHHAKAGLL